MYAHGAEIPHLKIKMWGTRWRLAAAKDLLRQFGAGGEEGEGCGSEPDERCEGDGEHVFRVGGDGRQKVRGGGCGGVGDECGEECAGEFAKLQVGE